MMSNMTLPHRCVSLADHREYILHRLTTGEITEDEAIEEAQTLILTDSQNVQWTIGIAYGGWWMRPDPSAQWVQASPPADDPTLNQPFGALS